MPAQYLDPAHKLASVISLHQHTHTLRLASMQSLYCFSRILGFLPGRGPANWTVPRSRSTGEGPAHDTGLL